MTAFWLWNAWRGFRGYIIPGTLQLFVLHFRMMLRVRDSCFLRSCFMLLRRHVSESLSSLDYTAFNETRVRFLFTPASAIQKIHSSLLYNHFNRKKKMTTLIVTEHSLCFFSSSGIYVENYPRTQHAEEHSDPTAVWTLFFLPNNRWPLQTEPVLCLVKKPPEAVAGEGGSQGEEEEAVLGISAQRPEWTPDRLFWPSPGYQNKRTQRHINHHVG